MTRSSRPGDPEAASGRRAAREARDRRAAPTGSPRPPQIVARLGKSIQSIEASLVGALRRMRPHLPELPKAKGNLSPASLWGLGILAGLPLLSVSLRVLALPGVVGPEIGGITAIGTMLTQIFSLSDIPADQRGQVLHLLFLPTSALLVALARLTFGFRVLGFRSILIAVGFAHSGIIPSLLLITIAVLTIVLVRPWLRAIRLPYYGRVSVILCIVALTMVGALLAGPFMRSDVLWGMAYFPVIVLGMLAEGIANTVDRDNVVTATWRAITTILLAFLIALVSWIPVFRSVLLQFPELALTQIVGIVLIAEFLDLGLFKDLDRWVASHLLPRPAPGSSPTRVAVVRTRRAPFAVGRRGRVARRQDLRSVQGIVDALRGGGYKVKVMEGDTTLLRELRRFFPADPLPDDPVGIVLNLAYGTRGHGRTTHVPALLEMAGVVYVGPAPLGHAMAFDPIASRVLMKQAHIPTPAFRALVGPRDRIGPLRFPVTVIPRYEPGAEPETATDRRQLRAAVRRILRQHRQESFVQEQVAGRRISAALLGNAPVQVLPLVEISSDRRRKICPAGLDEKLAERVRDFARATFWACGCRDYARVDFCIEESGDIQVLGVKTLGILARGGSFVLAVNQTGMSFEQLMCRLIEVARLRHLTGEPLRIATLRLPKAEKSSRTEQADPRGREGRKRRPKMAKSRDRQKSRRNRGATIMSASDFTGGPKPA